MNKLEFDPARSTAIRALLVERAAVRQRPAGARTAAARAVDRQRLIVTGVVAAVVVLVSVFAVRAGGDLTRDPLPARSGETTRPLVSSAALREVLPKAPGTVLHTWTSEDRVLTTGPFPAAGRSVQWTAACEGGGSITITVPNRAPFRLDCATRKAVGPNGPSDLHAVGKPQVETHAVRFRVAITSGRPSFRVQLTAVDPRILLAQQGDWSISSASAVVPESLRTCNAKDLGQEGTFSRLPGSTTGVVTITNTSSSDCAVRSWPTVRYLDADGMSIGGPAEHDVGSTRQLSKYGEFPPARLSAGADGYFIAQLLTLDRLRRDDARVTGAPTSSPDGIVPPVCHPRQVMSLLVGIGGASITVQTPDKPATAACVNKGFVFGVRPVVTTKPTSAE
jgi:hypothetical protein